MGWYDSTVGVLGDLLGNAAHSKQNLENMVYEISRQEKAAAGGSWFGETWAGAKAGLKLATINLVYAPGETVLGGAYIIAKEGPNLGKNTAIVYDALSSAEGRANAVQNLSDGAGDLLLGAKQTVEDAYARGELLELGGKIAGNVVSPAALLKKGVHSLTPSPRHLTTTTPKNLAAKPVSNPVPVAGAPAEAAAKRNTPATGAALSAQKPAANPPCQNCKGAQPKRRKPVSKRTLKNRQSKELQLKTHPALDDLTKGNPKLRRHAANIVARHNSVSGKKLTPVQVRNFQLNQFRDAQALIRAASKKVPANTATFYSGFFRAIKNNGLVIRAEAVARDLESTGLRTIFSTQAGKLLSELEGLRAVVNGKDLNFGQLLGRQRLTSLWEIASHGFAQSAEGLVTIIKGTLVLPKSIYNRIETPALARNLAAVERVLADSDLGQLLNRFAGEAPPSWLPQNLLDKLLQTKTAPLPASLGRLPLQPKIEGGSAPSPTMPKTQKD